MTTPTLSKTAVHSFNYVHTFRDDYFVSCKCGWKSGMHGSQWRAENDLNRHLDIEALKVKVGFPHQTTGIQEVYTDLRSTCSCGWTSKFVGTVTSGERKLLRHLKKTARKA